MYGTRLRVLFSSVEGVVLCVIQETVVTAESGIGYASSVSPPTSRGLVTHSKLCWN